MSTHQIVRVRRMFKESVHPISALRLNDRGLIGEDWFWDAVTRNDILIYHFGKHDPEPAQCTIKNPYWGFTRAYSGDWIVLFSDGTIFSYGDDIFNTHIVHFLNRAKINGYREFVNKEDDQ